MVGHLRHRAEAAGLVEVFGLLQYLPISGGLLLLHDVRAVPQVVSLCLAVRTFFGDTSPKGVVAVAIPRAVGQFNVG